MNHLTKDQENIIAKKIASGEIVSQELHEDLLDHFCCSVEELMSSGKTFEESLELACQQICPDGVTEFQQQVINLKNVNLMKQSTITLGILAISLASAGVWFKMCHWPAANIILILAAGIIVLGFLPLLFMYNYSQDRGKHTAAKRKNLLGYISISLISIACVCKVFHVPGTMILFLAGFLLLNIGFLPLLFFKKYRIA